MESDPADAVSPADEIAALQRKIESLEEGLTTRGEIGQAIGVLIAMYGLEPGPAWDLLSRKSQDKNIKVRDLARLVVATAIGEGLDAVKRLLHERT